MKRLFALLLALALCVSLCACGQSKSGADTPGTGTQGAPIPKGGESAPTAAPSDAPAAGGESAGTQSGTEPEATPAPTEAPPAADIAVSDLCAITGSYTENGGWMSRFSYVLPVVSGVDTPYIREVNDAVREIYDSRVQEALNCMESEVSLYCYCVSYLYGVRDGVHSLLVTCDSDWGMDEYWCFNFDDAGNQVDNETVLKAVGLKPDQFVDTARAYFTETTDLSMWFDDDGWKVYQEQTLSEDNCNADMPMAILPDGDLCFIGTIYTPAGAGAYDHALKIDAGREVRSADVGRTLLSRLTGAYDVDLSSLGPDYSDGSVLQIFTVGDTLMMEVTGYEKEYGSVMYYFGTDLLPEDPSLLLRADTNSLRVRALSHCPSVMGGGYYGEPGVYTLTIDGDRLSFTDFGGGTPVIGGSEGFAAERCYLDDLGMEDAVPQTDYDKFDYDAVDAAGIAGIWGGSYVDDSYRTHSISMELMSWGKLTLRDCVDGSIPRVLDGSYYIAGEDDDMASEGAVVFNLVARNDYKMPVTGYCYMTLDEDGTLLIDEDPDSYLSPLLETGADYRCVMNRVPAVRFGTQPQIRALEEGETADVDIDADGQAEEISCRFERDADAGNAIMQASFTLDGEEYYLSDLWLYDAAIYLVQPAYTGAVYLYIDGLSDNDAHVTTVVGFSADSVWYVDEFSGGFAEKPTDAEAMRLAMRWQLLSTMTCVRTYRVGMSGLPEAAEPYFRAADSCELTARKDVSCAIVAPDDGTVVDFGTIPAGEKVKLFRTDGRTFWDVTLRDGGCRRIWVSTDGWPQTVDGIDIEDCFDGIRFAG